MDCFVNYFFKIKLAFKHFQEFILRDKKIKTNMVLFFHLLCDTLLSGSLNRIF